MFAIYSDDNKSIFMTSPRNWSLDNFLAVGNTVNTKEHQVTYDRYLYNITIKR